MKALQIVGLVSILDDMGMREFRFHAGKVLSPAIYDLLRSIKKIEPQEDWLTKHYSQIQKIIDNNKIINLKEVKHD